VQGGFNHNEYEWDRADKGDPDIDLDGSFDSGFVGVELGYNRQIARRFVLGLELTGTYANADDHQVFRDTDTNEIRHFTTGDGLAGTFALRAGVPVLNNKLLLFAKGGGAVTHWNYDYLNDQTLANSAQQPEGEHWSQDETRVSPLAGAGAEYAISCHWTAKAEWNHVFGGDETVRGTLHRTDDPDTGPRSDDPHHGYKIDLDQDNVIFGLNYKF